MKWINFLHLYQPPTQSKGILDTVIVESYKKILTLLEEFPNLKLTINLSGSLLELFEKFGYSEIIKSFSNYVQKGRIELVGSAMYHPILPLIPKDEVVEQIKLHDLTCKKHFGDLYKPKGFYLPEMAYSPEVGQVIKELSFEWIILDEIHSTEKTDSSIKYSVEDLGLGVVFRDNIVSKTFPPEFIFQTPEILARQYLITAHDAELYGHWHKNDNGFYKKAFSNPDIQFLTVSEYRKELSAEKKISLINANWESLPEELGNNIPFALWKDPKNIIQEKLWNLANTTLAILGTENARKDREFEKATLFLHRGLASCAWWWASERRLGPFSPISWNPTETMKGANELLNASRVLNGIDQIKKIQTQKMFNELEKIVWDKHGREYDKKI